MYRRKSVVTLQSERPTQSLPNGQSNVDNIGVCDKFLPPSPPQGGVDTLTCARQGSFHLRSPQFQIRSPPPPPTDTYSDVINIGLPPSEGEGFKIVLQAIEQSGERGNQYIFKLRQTSSSTLAKPVELYEKLKTEKLGIAKMETPPRMIKRGVRFSPPLKEKFIRV